MIFQISSKTFKTDGSITLQANPNKTKLGTMKRRNSRSPTLDGSVAVADFGYTDGDRSITIVFTNETAAKLELVKELVRTSPRLLVSYTDGLYEAIVNRLVLSDPESTLTLDIVEQAA